MVSLNDICDRPKGSTSTIRPPCRLPRYSAVAWWCSAGSTAVGRARVSTGSLVRRVTSWTTQSGKRVEHVSELPVALTVRKGELLPPTYRWRATEDTEFVRIGMHTGLSLFVWLPENAPRR